MEVCRCKYILICRYMQTLQSVYQYRLQVRYKNYDNIYFKNNIRKKSDINLSEYSSKMGNIDAPTKYNKKDFPGDNFFKMLLRVFIYIINIFVLYIILL